ncbi:hypothetical protein ACH5RR_019508 [Cinchona calisaya]|uniref:Micro-fibrillar-associated protein 1 C-terminal domain-containing protein n=1 Tax=Cinchona calisaya TaxID=153742 RepID=A0ABD2ZQH2_9GENT
MFVTAGISDTVIAIRDKLRGKIGQTKVKRYWPGKAPEWADDNDEDGDIRMSRAAALDKSFPKQDDVSDSVRKDDPRLRRLAESRIDNQEEDEDALEERRRRIREKLLLRQQEEAALLPEEEEEEVRRRRRGGGGGGGGGI